MILLLAGTAQARVLAGYLHDAGIACTASLAGVTRAPAQMPVPTRYGGFGGDQGFENYIEAEKITAVIDATHPFATFITERTARVCAHKKIPYLRLERAVWRSRPGDAWHEATDYAALNEMIEPESRVFWAAGRQALEEVRDFEDRDVICRIIDPPSKPFPLKNGAWCIGQPPFSEADELATFKELNPDWLVVKNAGGGAGRSKLDAARALGIRVAMIARPPGPEGIERREHVCDALEWAENINDAILEQSLDA